MERAVEQDNRGVVRMTTLCAGLILLMLSLALGIAAGAVHISLSDIYQAVVAPGQTDNYRIIYTLRMPRAICAALAGANLALSGCILQGILRNPLADPGIIGISAGAGLAAMASCLLRRPLRVSYPLQPLSVLCLPRLSSFFLPTSGASIRCVSS